MAATEQEIGRMIMRLMLDNKQMIRELKNSVNEIKKTNKEFTTTGKQIESIGKKMDKVGRTMAMRITAPLATIGTLAIREFGKFDQAMTESTSIMSATVEQMDRMRSIALNLALDGSKAPEEMARSYFFLASAGKDAEQSMALLPTLSKFASAGAFEMALATDLLTDAQSALGMSFKDVAKDQREFKRLADVLTKGNILANASIEQFSIALTHEAGSSLKVFGKDVEEGVAVLAAMADQGIKAQVAGTGLSRIIRLLSASTLKNSKEHERLGFHVFDVSGKMRNFADIVENLEQVLAGLSDQQKAATLEALGFEARIQGVILPLIGTSKAIRRYESELRKAGGTTELVADKQMKSFNNQLKNFINLLKVTGIELGESLLPLINAMIASIREAVLMWRSWSSETKHFIAITGVLVAATGPLVFIFGQLSIAGTSLVTTYFSLAEAARKYTIALAALRVVQKSFGVGVVIAFTYEAVKLLHDLTGATEAYENAAKAAEEAQRGFNNSISDFNANTQKKLADAAGMDDAGKRGQFLGKELNDAALEGQRLATERKNALGRKDRLLGEARGRNVAPELGEVNRLLAENDRKMQANFDRINQLKTAMVGAKKEMSLAEFGKNFDLGKMFKDASGPTIEWALKVRKVNAEVTDLNKSLKEQLANLKDEDITNRIKDLEKQGATKGQIDELKALNDQIQNFDKQKNLMEEGKQVTESVMKPSEKFAAGQEHLNELLAAGAISVETYNRSLKELKKQTSQDFSINAGGVEGRSARGLSGLLARYGQQRGALSSMQSAADIGAPGQMALAKKSGVVMPSQESPGMEAYNKRRMDPGSGRDSNEWLKKIENHLSALVGIQEEVAAKQDLPQSSLFGS